MQAFLALYKLSIECRNREERSSGEKKWDIEKFDRGG